MYWTLELASKLEDAPWPASKDELIDYAIRSGAPMEVIENLQDIEDDEEIFESIEDIWPDYPSKDDFFFNEDEYYFSQVDEKDNYPLRKGWLVVLYSNVKSSPLFGSGHFIFHHIWGLSFLFINLIFVSGNC